MSKNIPIVIIHTGYKDYLKINLEMTGQKNKIYLIGDVSLKHLEKLINVTFVDINKYRLTESVNNFKKHFVNYSSNDSEWEWRCFERIFILKPFMKEYNLENVFHMDSDNILLIDINTYPFKKKIAYCLNKNFHANRMSYSIHVGLLTIDFCNAFIQLYKDLYVNKSKFHLIKNKIEFHTDPENKNKFIKGGLCDMTLYYLLASEKIIDVYNLQEPNNGTVFINNINSGEGHEYKNQYKISNHMLKLTINENNVTIEDIKNNTILKIMNIHFQGRSKNRLNESLKLQLMHILK